MPIPITTAPWIWFRPASGLIMRPASITVTTRLTRKRAISGCQAEVLDALMGSAVFKRRTWCRRCNGQQRCAGAVCRRKDSIHDRRGRHRAARERALRQRRITERDVDLVERHAGPLRGELREDGVGAGADVLRGTCYAGCAVIAQLYGCVRRESWGR